MDDPNPTGAAPDDLEARLAIVEKKLATLLEQNAGVTEAPNRSGRGDTGAAVGDDEDAFWVLEGVQRRHPEGAITYAGAVEVPGAGSVKWQYGRTSEAMLASDWTVSAEALAALGHPVRLMLLQLVMNGVASTAELADRDEVGTSGQVHHHLRTLMSAGWLEQAGRGHYRVSAARVVPLMIILLASGSGS